MKFHKTMNDDYIIIAENEYDCCLQGLLANATIAHEFPTTLLDKGIMQVALPYDEDRDYKLTILNYLEEAKNSLIALADEVQDYYNQQLRERGKE